VENFAALAQPTDGRQIRVIGRESAVRHRGPIRKRPYWVMREISTHVDINAGASLVWDILTDFGTYRRWNPLIPSVLGSARRGNTIMLTQKRGADRVGRTSTVRRTVKHVREPRELYWRSNGALEAVFASERRFRIESLPDGRVRFHQSERFEGVAVPFLWPGLQRGLTTEFGAMNLALKVRAERAEAEYAASRTRPGPAH
jgi:hypothetical protein